MFNVKCIATLVFVGAGPRAIQPLNPLPVTFAQITPLQLSSEKFPGRSGARVRVRGSV